MMLRVGLVCSLAILSIAAKNVTAAAQSPDFKVCKSTYALCTTAACAPVPGKAGIVSCACEVKSGYSAGLEPCQSVESTSDGAQVRSRYYPITAYAVCSNDRPWAWCLDKPCIIDKDDATKAACECTAVKDQGPYVIVTNRYTDSTCTTGVVSSATVTQVRQVTDFLKMNGELKPFEIDVLNSAE